VHRYKSIAPWNEHTLFIMLSYWFVFRYAQTTPMNNETTSDQTLLDLRRAQESFMALVIATAI